MATTGQRLLPLVIVGLLACETVIGANFDPVIRAPDAGSDAANDARVLSSSAA